jgi:hypothetical protein
MVRVKKIGVLSAAKILGILGAGIGLVLGLLAAAAASLMAIWAPALQLPQMFPLMSAGWAGLILFPIFYGICGFIGGLIGAAVYNIVAGVVGGLEIELEPENPRAAPEA